MDFPIHFMAYWWLFWIALSYSSFNEFTEPSYESLAQYMLLIVAFVSGHITMKRFLPHDTPPASVGMRGMRLRMVRFRWTLIIAALGSLIMIVLSLKLAGAFDFRFIEYYTKLRISGGLDEGSATGIKVLDVLTKILAFPLAYTILVAVLAVDVSGLRTILFACIASFVCFSYLWQVNYPLIHLFWIMVFYTLVNAQRQGRFNGKLMTAGAVICAVLLASSANRFGGEIIGGIKHYVIDYHLIGFSFYDYQNQNSASILHAHSFGRSSLGFLEQVLENLLKPLSIGFQAASSENSEYLNTAIDIGSKETLNRNAFGTIVFTLYRDFNLIGILLGGFLYGAVVSYARYRSRISWRHGALFLMLASAWMMGMMVSPLEAAYFWFVIVALGLLQVVNRGVRL
jgi:oligosaccharide repeat unit polymerase